MAEKNNNDFPFEIKKVDPKITAELRSKFKGQSYDYVRVGPKGYFLPEKYAAEAAQYYSMPVRPSDVFVLTYPRSGTTWTQELVWLIANDFDYDKAAATHMNERFPFLELSLLFSPALIEEYRLEGNMEAYESYVRLSKSSLEGLAAAPSPRFIKSHLPLSLLPPALLAARVVFVARDPRDVAVSFYHLNRLFRNYGYVGDFKTYWNFFINDLILWTPFFEYIKEGWEKRHHPNVLFLFYEELSKDLPSAIKKVAKFLDKLVTEEQVAKLTDHLNIENFKKNKSLNDEHHRSLGVTIPNEQSFIRKGKAGGWRDYFDEEMARQAERWIADHLRDTDLRFPQ